MTELEKQRQKLDEDILEINEKKEDVFNAKNEITITALGILLETLNEHINDMAEIATSKEYYDKDLPSTLKTIITEAIKAFSQLPQINIKPNISVDIKPLQSIAENISKQNQSLLDLINKMSKGNNSDELYKLVIVMVNKNNAFLENFNQINYTELLNKIINKNDRIEKLTAKRDNHNLLVEVIPVYKDVPKNK